jgi:PAS domain S-box-containing protein/putative nucleotidyltransferase with HDIG domain
MPIPSTEKTQKNLVARNSELRARLDEADETLRAIRTGEVDALIVSGADGEQIYTLKPDEGALQESEEKFRRLVESLPSVVYMNAAGDAGSTIYVSPQIKVVLGYTRAEWLADSKLWSNTLHPDDRERVMARVAEVNQSGQPFNMQYRMVARDGHHVWMHDQAVLVNGPEGRPVFWQGVMLEISERKQIEEQIRQRLAELEALHVVSAALRAAQTRDEALPILLDKTLAGLETNDGMVWLYDPESDELRAAVTRGWFANVNETAIKPGEGISGSVFASGQTHTSIEFKSDPLSRSGKHDLIPAGAGGACVPILSGEARIGVMIVSMAAGRQITTGQVSLLESLAEMAGTALHRMRLYEDTSSQLARLQALRSIDQSITGSFNLQMTLNIILQEATTQMKVDAAAVLLLSPQSSALEFAAGHGFLTREIEKARINLGEGHAGRVALERRTMSVADLAGSDFARGTMITRERFVSHWATPLISKGQVKGVLEVFQRSPFTPSPGWADFLETLAGQAAIAIDNSQLFENLQRSNIDLSLAYDATIEGWSHALDLRDKETEGHTLRVTETTLRLARDMGFSGEELIHIRRGALLHDIGKMGVPDTILLKPGPLTEEEWKLMHQHPRLAYDMLSPIGYLRPSLDIPYYHHEKWDGSGYPLGLKGEQIPLVARIFAVVDVWDALSSDRPYRSAWPPDKVRAYILSSAGTHFDPQVVGAFMQMTDKATVTA